MYLSICCVNFWWLAIDATKVLLKNDFFFKIPIIDLCYESIFSYISTHFAYSIPIESCARLCEWTFMIVDCRHKDNCQFHLCKCKILINIYAISKYILFVWRLFIRWCVLKRIAKLSNWQNMLCLFFFCVYL